MLRRARGLLEDFARSTIGAMNLGLPLLYTMETWWLAWRLPLWLLGAFAFVGVSAIAIVIDFVGIRADRPGRQKSWRQLGLSTVELLLSSFVASLAVLLLIGIIEWGDPAQDVVRHGLMQVVPLGLGAAVANVAFEKIDREEPPPSFRKEMAAFGIGAAFFAFSVAPTEEVELMAAHAGWWRLVLLAASSIVFAYVVLYVVEFRGHAGRLAGMRQWHLRVGETLAGYALAVAVATFLLFGYGHFQDATLPEAIQKVVLLAFVASFGGAAARVVV